MPTTYAPATPEEVTTVMAAFYSKARIPTGFAVNMSWDPPVRRIVGGTPDPDELAAIRAARIVRGAELDALVPGPGEEIRGGPIGPVRRKAMPQRKAGRIAAIGDSITAGATAGNYIRTEPLAVATLLSGGRLLYHRNAGVSGNTTAQMLARIQADVIAHAPDRCVILGGTNDVPSVPTATTLANLQAMVDALLAADIIPVLCTIPPRNDGYHTEIGRLNVGIKRLALTNGLTCVDYHRALSDPATGNYKAGLNTDALHPAAAGQKVMGQALWDALAPSLPQRTPYLTDHLGDPVNLLTNGVFVGDANSDGLADGWTLSSGANSVTTSLEAGTGEVVGNWQVLTTTTAGGRNVSPASYVTTGFAVGDRLQFAGRISATVEAGALSYYLRWMLTGGTTAEKVTPVENWTIDVANGVFSLEFTVPPGTTQMRPQLVTGGTGTGTVKMAQLTLVNLTALGVA